MLLILIRLGYDMYKNMVDGKAWQKVRYLQYLIDHVLYCTIQYYSVLLVRP